MSLLQLPIFLGPPQSPQQPTKHERRDSESKMIAKPFFIMDWLEEMAADQDAETLARLLQTPQKAKYFNHHSRHSSQGSEDYRDDCDVPSSPAGFLEYNPQTSNSCPSTPKSSNRAKVAPLSAPAPQTSFSLSADIAPTRLFDAPLDDTTIPPLNDVGSRVRLPSRRKPKQREGTVLQRSIKLANGWNAKGLQKATQELWNEALACWDNALEIRLALLGSHHYEVANSYNNRGIALGKLGRYGEALDSLHAALDIRLYTLQHQEETKTSSSESKALDKNAPVSILQNMANVHQQAGNLSQALEALKNAQECATGIYLARVCVAMGHVYHDAEQWIDALDAYRDAMGIYQRELMTAQGNQPQNVGASDPSSPLKHSPADQRTIDECSEEIAELEHYIQEHRLRGIFTNSHR